MTRGDRCAGRGWTFAGLGSIPRNGVGHGVRQRGARAGKGGAVLGGVEHERLLELVGQLGQLSHERVEQCEDSHGDLGDVAYPNVVPDFTGHQVEERSGGDGLGSGKVPHLSDGTIVGAQRGQSGSNIGHIAVGVRQVGVADEIGPLGVHGVGKNSLPEGCLGDAGTEEIRCSPDGDTDPARLGCREKLGGHGRPGAAFGGRGGEGEIFGHRLGVGWPVAVEVLQ